MRFDPLGRCTRLDVRNVYGVLVPSWDGFADPGAGIGPADVGAHWQEMAQHTGQPMNSSLWENDPVSSTIPATAALLRVRDLAPEAEHTYLRRLRELVMAKGRNIARPEHLAAAALNIGLSEETAQQVALPLDATDLERINQERRLMHELGATAFPTLVFESAGQQIRLTGVRRYQALVAALQTLDEDAGPGTTLKAPGNTPVHLDQAFAQVLDTYPRATTREVAAAGQDDPSTETALDRTADRTGLLWAWRPTP
ncbi:hypothetical protein ACFYY1_30395 [Streptomyces sp. NPDC001890]|uniref:hypothetical protein n=1 Tax=Streptomyces sp. NPDC001890 TaxID=3364620 RepID=UPI00368012A9